MTKSPPLTVTTRVVTEINRTAILDALIAYGPMSRKQIVSRTGLGSATVERLCAALVADRRIVIDSVERTPTGGRPSSLLRYSGSARAVVAIEVSETAVRGRIVDLDGKTVAELRSEFDFSTGSKSTARLEGTVNLAMSLVDKARTADLQCEGIGISVPGIVHDGKVMNTVELGWREVPVGSIVESRTGVHTLVENDANAIAFGEWARGAAVGARSVASFVLGVGVGAGIVDNGRIYRGARSAAGEVGYLFADTSALGRYFTEEGDLESRIAELTTGDRPAGLAPMRRLLSPTAVDDPALSPAVSELFDLIAFSCGAVATILDPEVIVLAGHLVLHPEHAIDQISRRLTGRIPFPPRFLVGSLGDDAALVGVGELIAREARGATYIA